MSLVLCELTNRQNNLTNLTDIPIDNLVNLREKYIHYKVPYLPYANNGDLIESSDIKIYKLDSLDDLIFKANTNYYKISSNVYDQSKFIKMKNIISSIFNNNPFVLIHNLLHVDLKHVFLIEQLKQYYNISTSTSYELYEVNEIYVPSILVLNSSSDNYTNNNLLINEGAVAYNLAMALHYFNNKEINKSLENIKLTPKPNRHFSICSLKYYINENMNEVFNEFIKPIENKLLNKSKLIINPYDNNMLSGFKSLAILISKRNKYTNLSDKDNNITFEYISSSFIHSSCLVSSFYHLMNYPIPKEKYNITL